MRLRHDDLTWRYNVSNYRFMRDKSAATIDVLALAIPLFSLIRNLIAASRMGGVTAFRTIHHC
jgi:hypothetical protein